MTVLSSHYGKIRVLAKGIRKINSRRASHLQLFNQLILLVSCGKNFDILNEVETINFFAELKKNLKLIAWAYRACELIDRLVPDHQENRPVFNLLVSYFNNLNKTKVNPGFLFYNFETEILKELGFWPKDRASVLPDSFNIEAYIERIIERKLISKNLLDKIG